MSVDHTPKDLGSTTSPLFLQRVKETLSILLGNRGDGDSRALTVRDLQDTGVLGSTITAKAQAAASSVSSSNTTIINTVVEIEPDLTPPPMPTGFSASAAISNLVITCDAQGYTEGHGHYKSVLYGKTYTSGALPVFANALVLTEFAGSVFSYSTNPATTWRLWLKWMSVDEVLSSNPAGGINGIAVTTGQNVATLLTALTGQIRATELEIALGTRIDLVDGNGVGSVNARVADEAAIRGAAIITEATTRNNADSAIISTATALAVRVTTAEGGITTNAAAITTEASARANADSAIVSTATTLTARVTTAEGGITTNAAAITTEQTARVNADAAITSSVTTLSATVGDHTAAIQTEATTRADADTGLYAQYTIKLDVGGKVSGFGLASTTTSSAFAIRADRFYISPPATGGGTATEIIPFIVQASPTTINGVAVPAGVYMDTAFIRDGTITNVKIGNAAIDDAKITTLSASKLRAGAVSVGQDISSSNYVAGSAGWMVSGTGGAEFSGVTIRGNVYATAGTIGGNTIDSVAIRAGQTAWNTGTGFYLGSNGTFSVGNSLTKRLTWDGSNINIVSPGFTLINGAAKLSGELNIGAFTGYFWPGDPANSPTPGVGAHIGPSGFLIGNYRGIDGGGPGRLLTHGIPDGKYFQIAIGNTAGSEAAIYTNIPAYLADLQVTTLKINNNAITYSSATSNLVHYINTHGPSTLMIVAKLTCVGDDHMGARLFVSNAGALEANWNLLDSTYIGGGGHYIGIPATCAGVWTVPAPTPGVAVPQLQIVIQQWNSPQYTSNPQITVLEVQK